LLGGCEKTLQVSADMGVWLSRLKKNIRSIRQIVREKQFCLLRYLSSIDDDFYIQNEPSAENDFERSPHPLFDTVYYRNRYLEKSFNGHPFCHFMTVGFSRGYKPGPFFDYDIYEKNTDWQQGRANPLKHYLKQRNTDWPSAGIFFDIQWYRDKTPILYQVNVDPIKHYRIHGAGEGKSPLPFFDPEFYLNSIPDNPHASADPLSHYLIYGILEDKQPCPWFDPVFYKEKYSSVIGELFPLEHYLKKGLRDGNYCVERLERLKSKPLISIIVPVYNADPFLLNYCIRSVLNQQYPHWQLCLADDGSSREGLRDQLEKWGKQDSRIKTFFNENNQGISAASNSAAALADGDYVGFLDNDDELTPDCLYHIAETISRTSAEVVYTDEDLIGIDGGRLSVFYKPDFNKVLLQSHNYITHFLVVSRPIFTKCQGFRSEYDGAQDFDLMLRISDLTDKIVHVPLILYHWRATKTSTSINHSQKSYAHEAGKKALAEYIDKNPNGVSVEDTDINYFYRIKKETCHQPTINVLVWSNQPQTDIKKFTKIRKVTAYEKCDFILISGQLEAGGGGLDKGRSHISEGVYLEQSTHFVSKAQSLTDVIASCDCDFLVFLDSSVSTVESGWLSELVSQIKLAGVGIACGRFSYPDGDGISYAVPDLNIEAPRYYLSFLTSCSRHLNGLHCSQFIQFSPWDICIIRRRDYNRLGGFDHENYPSLFAMTDLALRAVNPGFDIVYTPYARVIGEQEQFGSHEFDKDACLAEKTNFQSKWRDTLKKMDPYYNLNILDEHNVNRNEFFSWFIG
jgi:glycosyltransferase involved in cell wall biosynthesis